MFYIVPKLIDNKVVFTVFPIHRCVALRCIASLPQVQVSFALFRVGEGFYVVKKVRPTIEATVRRAKNLVLFFFKDHKRWKNLNWEKVSEAENLIFFIVLEINWFSCSLINDNILVWIKNKYVFCLILNEQNKECAGKIKTGCWRFWLITFKSSLMQITVFFSIKWVK